MASRKACDVSAEMLDPVWAATNNPLAAPAMASPVLSRTWANLLTRVRMVISRQDRNIGRLIPFRGQRKRLSRQCIHGRAISRGINEGIYSMFHLTAFVTLLAAAFYFFTSTQVARARAAFGIKAPAVTGHPDFERVFRVQMNTLEWMPIFLPSLWLFAIYISDPGAAALGAVWIVGRIMYWSGYKQAAGKRSMGFAVQATAAFALWLGALGAIGWRAAH